MRIFNHIHKTLPSGLKPWGVLLIFSLCSFVYAHADIVIGGSVYGGGKSAEVGTSRASDNTTIQTTTTVIVNSGTTINENVFGAGDGSAAIVYGNAVVQINGGKVVQNVYGGGNMAPLHGATDILIAGGIIDNADPTIDKEADNAVFAGARMAAVNPDGTRTVPDITIDGSTFTGYSAHVLVTGGTINDLYGGNDITGKVNGGAVLEIRSSINGNIYGGGNGSYAYTDLQARNTSDFYYNPGASSITALNAHRPNADRVYIDVRGTVTEDPTTHEQEITNTVLWGSLFCGGNSATIIDNPSSTDEITLKIGKYVIADNVFLGNNGENMIDAGILSQYADNTYSTLTTFNSNSNLFGSYMDGAAMSIKPRITFANDLNYDSYIGSLFLGGNIGSMTYSGVNEVDFNDKVVIYNKIVGGCNTADVIAGGHNTAYQGGILGSASEQAETVNDGKYKTSYEGKDRIILNFNGPHLEPKYLIRDGENKGTLAWNTKVWESVVEGEIPDDGATLVNAYDIDPDDYIGYEPNSDLRLDGATVYGGCYTSGHVNGNVVINILDDLVHADDIFAQLDEHGLVTTPNSGVDYDSQGDDVLMSSLYVYGAGYGERTEIWGNTTVNINGGFAFQALGGGEKGVVGRKTDQKSASGTYYYDPAYSTYINLNGPNAGWSEDDDATHTNDVLAEAEYLYGGGFEGLVAGNTYMYLGNGRIYDSFGGACNADVLGHTETYIGKALAVDNDGKVIKDNSGNFTVVNNVFPWIIDNVYGGNDFGGTIRGSADFTSKVKPASLPLVYKYDETQATSYVLTASAYVEYNHGRVDTIYGGNYGSYDYFDPLYNKYTYTADYNLDNNGEIVYKSDGSIDFTTLSTDAALPTIAEGITNEGNIGTSRSVNYHKPYLENAFVNLTPTTETNTKDSIKYVFGAGMGTVGYYTPGDKEKDLMQKRSYVLVDLPSAVLNFQDTRIFGSGAYSGIGMFAAANPDDANNTTFTETVADNHTAVVDLIAGRIYEAYGASYNEGWTRRTQVNVPVGSTAILSNLFAGGHGSTLTEPCDVYEAHVNFNSDDARVGYIYGGNNNTRRTLYGFVDINAEVWSNKDNVWLGSVYGAGKGKGTWSQYTEVHLNPGTLVYEAYGGGYGGRVLDKTSFDEWVEFGKWREKASDDYEDVDIYTDLLNGYEDVGLNSVLVRTNNIGSDLAGAALTTKNNTNVYIHGNATDGIANVGYVMNRPTGGREIKGGYCYGGGYGIGHETYKGSGKWVVDDPEGGIVSGTTYVGLLGGTVWKDIYAAGTLGGVLDFYGSGTNIVANAYIEGGFARNVYGGGWEGDVGKTTLKVPYPVIALTDAELELSESDQQALLDSRFNALKNQVNNDVPGQTNVVIGIRQDLADAAEDTLDYYHGIPAIERRAFAGGEGGSVVGTANITINNGYIGYKYDSSVSNVHSESENEDERIMDKRYVAVIDDDTYKDGIGLNRLEGDGNVFGGGYDDKSTVDKTNVEVFGGFIRNSVYGGGEIATVGRGSTKLSGDDENATITLDRIYSGGETKVTVYSGNILRNVYAGGKGFSNLKEYGHGDVRYYTDGYIFGKTQAYIHGGKIGTIKGTINGDGNVFGGGNQGYVYSANGTPGADGYYYDEDDNLTEDCKVVISPWAKVIGDVTVSGLTNTDNISYAENPSWTKNQYIPTSFLNSIRREKNDENDENEARSFKQYYSKDNTILDDTGIKIHNGVFAGGNISSHDEMYANTTTVYGNATAVIYDVYNHDYITIGTDHVGGLYGDGNLTRVAGYRELNISNYGTDYWSFDKNEITLDYYENELTDRERAYFQLKFKLISGESVEYKGVTYEVKGAKTLQELEKIFPADYFLNGEPKGYNVANEEDRVWEAAGFCTIYAGRLLNTIQRADFVGIYGSRLVLQGAQDRVSSEVDYTNYTINRVGEISLNVKQTTASDTKSNDLKHGNYFGIYNVVNYLGALTSDVDFTATRNTSDSHKQSTDYWPTEQESRSFYQWKYDNATEPERNDGESPNKLALASGVYLELTKEPAADSNQEQEQKIYGEITGVIELDLINVQPYLGGGYVYAKNVHGSRNSYATGNVKLLSEYNKHINSSNQKAISKAGFTYDAQTDVKIQTSGNFVQAQRTIIDDCYPDYGDHTADAHYWYIKGSVYVYDVKVSAYTGAPSEYSKSVKIPLTITAGSDGKIKLIDVKPSKYAYWATNDRTDPSGENKVLIENRYFRLNDTISYWDWSQLGPTDQAYFVDETYVAMSDFYIKDNENNVTHYLKGETWLPAYYNSHEDDDIYTDEDCTAPAQLKDVVKPSNNMSHDNGYALTLSMTNPKPWDVYYTPEVLANANHTARDEMTQTPGANTVVAPTYKAYWNGNDEEIVLGQKLYEEGTIVPQNVINKHKELQIANGTAGIAKFAHAYILTAPYESEGWNTNNIIAIYKTSGNAPDLDGSNDYLYANVAKDETPTTMYNGISAEAALFCIDGWELKKEGLEDIGLPYGTFMSHRQIDDLIKQYYPEHANDDTWRQNLIDDHFTSAYYCITPGNYGGTKFEKGHNYKAIDAWAGLNSEDRQNFSFNYDAFDLLIDPDFSNSATWKYDGIENAANVATANLIYAAEQPIDYEAVYEGNDFIYAEIDASTGGLINLHRYATQAELEAAHPTLPQNGKVISSSPANRVLSRVEYESLPNECKKYSCLIADSEGKCYVVNTAFRSGEKPHVIGSTMSKEDYNGLPASQQTNVSVIDNINGNPLTQGDRIYYRISDDGGTIGDIISAGDENTPGTYNYYNKNNFQKGFSVVGNSPEQSATLYVSYESDLQTLSRGKVFTIEYEYNYQQINKDGTEITPELERHIVNIHVEFKSGRPIIGNLATPPTILPGSTLGLNKPDVTEGAYHTINSGWEYFTSSTDAQKLVNGIAFDNKGTPFYWYQNEYWVAYYARNYMGKAYSTPVKISVANYHDLDAVMKDKEHHMYVDNPDVKRDSKIYIDDRTCASDNEKSELDLLKDFFDLSLLTTAPTSGELEGHALLDGYVKGTAHIEFILNSDVAPQKYTDWTPLGNDNDDECFHANLHGDGHTISGLNNSLFGNMCGKVYNLGVEGSFTTSGIADYGVLAENCWVNTSGTIDANTKAIMGTGTIRNSYYPNNLGYVTTTGATPRPIEAFYNGEVAYDLNGFYLTKRYNDNTGLSSGVQYKYYVADHSTNNHSAITTAYYANNDNATYQFKVSKPDDLVERYLTMGYVESRIIDGDFRYSTGELPSAQNERYYFSSGDQTDYNGHFYPIWPDDYIFFGQKLTYGYEPDLNVSTYQSKPSAINKENRYYESLDPENDPSKPATFWIVNGTGSNRVYRAPAYYGNSTTSIAHFNQYAVLPDKTATSNTPLAQSLQGQDVYPGMTAVDFTASNPDSWVKGWNESVDIFMTPIMDMWPTEALTGFRTDGQTRNLLVYAKATTATDASATDIANTDVISSYLFEPEFDRYQFKLDQNDQPDLSNKKDYESVHKVSQDTINMVHGHLVLRSAQVVDEGTENEHTTYSYYAANDQFLVDFNDFNAPIAYTIRMADGHIMWYQRTPDVFVKNAGTGWETISLPFTATVVTTSQKGIITHFYSGSNKGHEYWLRTPASTTETDGVKKISFQSVAQSDPKRDINYHNSFLWDYYYSHNDQKDENEDEYQEFYHYSDNQNTWTTYQNYPLEAATKPYLIGFPSDRYYEFDMSGEFEPQNTYGTGPAKLNRQTITFISESDIHAQDIEIGVSDEDYSTATAVGTAYVFRPTYQTMKLDGDYTYLLNATNVVDSETEEVTAYAGTVFRNDELPANTLGDDRLTQTTVPFRAYFTAASYNPYNHANAAQMRRGTRGEVLYIDYDGDVMPLEEVVAEHGLLIYGDHMNIYVESTLEYPTQVTIMSVSGKTLKQFSIQPGTKVQVPVSNRGVYIVNHKKIAVTR